MCFYHLVRCDVRRFYETHHTSSCTPKNTLNWPILVCGVHPVNSQQVWSGGRSQRCVYQTIIFEHSDTATHKNQQRINLPTYATTPTNTQSQAHTLHIWGNVKCVEIKTELSRVRLLVVAAAFDSNKFVESLPSPMSHCSRFVACPKFVIYAEIFGVRI